MNINLLTQWNRLLAPFGLSKERRLESYRHIIHPAYTESHRRYHNISHIEQCLKLVHQHTPYVSGVDAIVLALFFHDIVYDPQARNNEQASVDRLEAMAPHLNLPPGLVDAAGRAILWTDHKTPPIDDISRYVVDIDLAVFGLGTEEDYDKGYAWQIREEYRHVTDVLYKEVRAKVLQAFLDRPSIYYTKIFRDAYEQTARARLAREIGILRRSP